MVLFPLPSLLLLLSGVEGATASALLGRQRPPSNGLDKRQGSNSFIRFPTIYDEGDPNKPRTAESGYDIRVDVANSAFGFCAANNPNQCDMAGVCVDSFTCSRGCGFGNTALKTWTCADPNARYCSTALLTLSSDSPRAVTYLACADKPDRTQAFKAFTTNPTPSTSSRTAPTPLPTPQQTSQTSTTGTSPSQTASQSVPTITTTSSSSSASSSSLDAANKNNNDSNNNNNNSNTTNTAMIVGASVGCVALICICVVVVFLIRRSRNASAATAATTKETTETTTTGEGGGGGGQTDGAVHAEHKWQHLGGGHAVYEMGHGDLPGSWGRGGYPAAAPVELSATPRWSGRYR